MTHTFEVSDAVDYGVEKAIVLSHLRFWIGRNKANGRNDLEGRTWTYNSGEALAKIFPYWTPQKISRMLRDLEELKVIRSGVFNEHAYDRTKWYAFEDEKSMLQDWKFHSSEMNNGSFDNDQPIPDLLTDSLPDKNITTLEYSEEFKTFWKAYPRTVKKRAAFKCWGRRLAEGVEADHLIRCAKNFARAMTREKREPEHIAHPTTFLNSDHFYEDFETDRPPEAVKNGTDKDGNVWKDGKNVGYYDGSRFIPAAKSGANLPGILGGNS